MPVTFRPGSPEDSYAAFEIFEHSLADLNLRLGKIDAARATTSEALADMWSQRRSLFGHLADSADEFWLAEREDRLVGYSRSVYHDGLQELTELFILPGEQSAGAGRELLSRALPEKRARHRTIIASPDVRALALYLKSGLSVRFPLYYFWRRPEAVNLEGDLRFEPISTSTGNLALLGEIDRQILEHRRERDHHWLIDGRQGYLYYRDGHPVGYGYIGTASGPFALLEESDYPAVLAHAETLSASMGRHFGLEVPMVNETAVKYLLQRGFHMDTFVAQFLSDAPFGQFDKYIVTSPPFIM
jgi:GNAT superfamily N-acetyltransferase